MNGKLSRKWARISIVCMILFVIGAVISIFTNGPVGMLVGTPFAIVSLIIKFVVLRCPGCGHGGAVPQWSKEQKVYHCPRCGTKLEYDD